MPAAAAAAAPGTPVSAAAAASPTAAGAASPTSPEGALIPAGAFTGGSGSGAAATAAADAAGGLMTPGGVGGCSEYCARLCEAVYTASEHALVFLLLTAPVVEAGEVAAAGEGLGATWPSAKALAALQVMPVHTFRTLLHALLRYICKKTCAASVPSDGFADSVAPCR